MDGNLLKSLVQIKLHFCWSNTRQGNVRNLTINVSVGVTPAVISITLIFSVSLTKRHRDRPLHPDQNTLPLGFWSHLKRKNRFSFQEEADVQGREDVDVCWFYSRFSAGASGGFHMTIFLTATLYL